MGCLPSRHQLNNFKEERRRSVVERRMSHRMSEKSGNVYLTPPPRMDAREKAELTLVLEEANQSGRSSPHAMWTEDDTYIPRFDSTLPRLR
ncbi:hypothetical protein FRC11_006435 [Ceratobasidium sp. 423]|nr:hypothetical protein FRC11_006435 [Ceratobasidium sp. 423]